jgi:hypothetical protein
MVVGIVNGTPLVLNVTVNGQSVGSAPPNRLISAFSAALPPLPWEVLALTSSGRVVARIRVAAPITAGGTDDLVYLSCGTIDLFAGASVPFGPPGAPASAGAPGDCDP